MSSKPTFIKSKFDNILMAKPIETHTFSHVFMSYMGSKIPSFPYSVTIIIQNTIVNYENEVIMQAKVYSEFKLYAISPIQDMYDAHLKSISDLQEHLNKKGGKTFLSTYKVPIPPIDEVKESMIEAGLFDKLVIGLRLN